MRTGRTDGTTANTYSYIYTGSQLTQMKKGGTTFSFTYDANGVPLTFSYGNSTYYYATNLQGDVVALLRKTTTGMAVVGFYIYDAWGNCTISGNTSVLMFNPLRYRGYVYDQETGLYYLQSRYYDPEVGRFINADGLVTTGQSFVGNNMFAYCGNNPVSHIDCSGMFWEKLKAAFSGAWNKLKTLAKNTFGAGSSTTVTIAESETPIIPDPSPITITAGTQTTQTVSEHGDSSKPVSVYVDYDAANPITSSAGAYINISDFTLDYKLGLDNIGLYGSLTNADKTTNFGLRRNLSEFKIGFEYSESIQWDNTADTAYTNISINGWAIIAAYYYLTTGYYEPQPVYNYAG